MQRPITRGASAGAGLIFHVFAQDSAATDGSGKASVAFSSWACRYIRNGEAISGAITPEDITTIGTYAAPTANTNIRIKAVDNTNMIGVYEIQIHADWVNATNSCQSLTVYLTATGVAVLPLQIPLVGYNPQDAVALGLSLVPANVTQIGGDAQSATDLKDFADAGYDPGTNKVQGVLLVDTLTTYTGNTPQTGDVFPLASTEIADIKAKTDNLPSDPADQSLIIAAADSIVALIGTPVVTLAADLAAAKTVIDQIEGQTDDIGVAGAGLTAVALTAAYDPAKTAAQAGDAMALTAGERNSAADALLARTLGTESYAADGAVPTVAQMLFMLWSGLVEFSITGTTLTCKKLDGSTTAMTFTLDDASAPTSRTRAT